MYLHSNELQKIITICDKFITRPHKIGMIYVALVQNRPVIKSTASQNLKFIGLIPTIGLLKNNFTISKSCSYACNKVPVEHSLKE